MDKALRYQQYIKFLQTPGDNLKSSNVTLRDDLVYRDHPNYQSIFNDSNHTYSLLKKANNMPANNVLQPESIRSNQILIESDLSEFQERLYVEISSQLLNPDHPIHIMIANFKVCFVKQYKKYIDTDKMSPSKLKKLIDKKNKKLQKHQLDKLSDQASLLVTQENNNFFDEEEEQKSDFSAKVLNECLDFIQVVEETLMHFYETVISQNDLYMLFEDIHKLIVMLCCKDEVYRVLLILARIQNETYDKDLRQKYRELVHITPQDVGIDKYLLLNDASPMTTIAQSQLSTRADSEVSVLNKFLNKHSNPLDQEETKTGGNKAQGFSQQLETHNKQYELTQGDIQLKLKQKPYFEAVRMIRDISGKQCPFEKIFLLNEVRRSVDKNIQKFWAGIQVSKDKLELGTDQFLSIFMFIIIKSQVEDFKSQLELIKTFNSEYILNTSKFGHTLHTVSQALDRISKLDKQRLNEPMYVKNAIFQFEKEEKQIKQLELAKSKISVASSFNPFYVSNLSTKRGPVLYKDRHNVRSSYLSQSMMFDRSVK